MSKDPGNGPSGDADGVDVPAPQTQMTDEALDEVHIDDPAVETGAVPAAVLPNGSVAGLKGIGVDSPATAQRVVAHQRLAHQSRVVLRLGQMLLACGASAYRVKHSMARLAHAVGIAEHHAQVTYTEIVATAYANGTFRTELAEQRQMGINTDRLDQLSNYVESVRPGVRVEEVDDALDRIARRPALYPGWMNCLAAGLACAGFAFLNHGGPVECTVVLVAAMLGQWVRRMMMRQRMNHFGVWMTCGAVSSLVYVLLVSLAQAAFHLEPTHQAGFISALLFLVPGFPLVTGIIDLVRQDFQAGLARLVYVVMLVMSAGVAVWTVSIIFNWSVTPEYDYHLNEATLAAGRLVASFIASWGFAMLFNSPWRVCLAAAGIGAVVNVLRLIASDHGMPQQAAVGLAALLAGLLAAAVAARTRFSRGTLSTPAVVIMIPGVPLYRSLAYLNNGEVSETLNALFVVFFTIISIGVGLAIARMVTDRNWLTERPTAVPSLGEYVD